MRAIDAFALLNLLGFGVLCVLRYHERFIRYRGTLHLEEFYLYAVLIVAGIVLLWRWFRRFDWPWPLLLALQGGITLHFLGAFVPIEGGRLYDQHLAGVRYDKLVHLVNAATVAVMVEHLLPPRYLRPAALQALAVVLIVLGLGAVVEIVEYAVVLTVRDHGVGDYDNNMQDLVANLIGATTAVAVAALKRRGRA